LAQVTLTIHGQTYQIACEDGEEDRLRELGAYVDSKMQELAQTVGRMADSRMFLLASLLLADEIFDLRSGGEGKARSARDAALAERLNAAAEQIETIVARLEQA